MLQIERRFSRSARTNLIVTLLAVGVALSVGALLLALVGTNPLDAYAQMAQGAFGDSFALSETLVKATPLLLTGLCVALALRAGFWNIGAEGQLVMGGFAATGVALFVAPHLPDFLILPALIAAGFIGGALYAMLSALLRIRFGVSEIVSTLMLNYIAVLWVQYLYFDAWRNSKGFGFPGTAEFPKSTWLPRITGRVHIGLIIGLVACALVWLLLRRAKFGYEIRLMGASLPTAQYAGIKVARNLLIVAALSGGLAGLAGMSEVAGMSHRLQNGLAVGYGYTGIIIAFLGYLSPVGVLLASLFIAGLSVGADQLQLVFALPTSFAEILQGVVLLCVIAGSVLSSYRVEFRRTARSQPTTPAPISEAEAP